MDNMGLLEEVTSRISLLNSQSRTAQSYLLDKIREEDWASAMQVCSQLASIDQELESLNVIQDKLEDNCYE